MKVKDAKEMKKAKKLTENNFSKSLSKKINERIKIEEPSARNSDKHPKSGKGV